MVTAREIMTRGAECARTTDSLVEVARRMKAQDVGALPICGDGDRLHGMITDRDIVVKCVASGDHPAERTVGELAQGQAITVGADDSVEEALFKMMSADLRRLPVVDGQRFVGVVSLVDLALNLPDDEVGELVGAVSSVPPSN
ncbi:CBS domain-containing protein [Nocardioides sp. CER19]|uniref:CBS domain-containing protein n=1 Tax=Nocardioides sp. CER19 TaxID=3038538 RepID=UPI002446CB96|nr:CBS domain-containing protein [Nocardioides sp. CER19]MDH2414094.1 CBS domain-containing protein [Nocardioides sp. CER19]